MQIIQPPGWTRPSGYSNGVLATGRLLFVAGQIAWGPDKHITTDDMAGQWEQALSNVLAVVREAGGDASNITMMLICTTSLAEYNEATGRIGEAWKRIMGRSYPAMMMFKGELLEPRAKVEIMAWAVLPSAD